MMLTTIQNFQALNLWSADYTPVLAPGRDGEVPS